MAEDDESLELRKRFQREGLDFASIPDEEKVLHVWCWLVDAETNCLSLRHQLEKLRRQQEEELKEVEEYVEHIWKLSSQKVAQLENENKELREQLEQYENQDATKSLVREIQQLLVDEGLVELANLGLKQQVSLLLAERRQLKSDLENEKWAKIDDDCFDEDDYVLDRRRRSEHFFMPSAAIVRNGNAICVSSCGGDMPKNHAHQTVYAKTDVKISSSKSFAAEIYTHDSPQHVSIYSSHENEPKNGKVSVSKVEECGGDLEKQCQQQQKQIQQQSERIRVLEKLAKQLELDNETLTFKLSEALTELDEMENQLRSSKTLNRKGSATRHSISSVSSGKLELLQSYLDTKLSNAHHDLSLVDQLQKMHNEITKLQEQLLASGKQLETLAMKYQQRKMRHKERIQRLRGYLEREQRKWKEQIQVLEHKLLLSEEALQKQKDWCAKVEGVRYILQEEKRQLCDNLLQKEEQLRKKERENLILLQNIRACDVPSGLT